MQSMVKVRDLAKPCMCLVMWFPKVMDDGIRNLTQALKRNQMWDNTLIIFTADNGGGMGGNQPSNDYPLRGTKVRIDYWPGQLIA